ncbi:MAG: HNH endonuclease [Pseudomonadota bacterium]
MPVSRLVLSITLTFVVIFSTSSLTAHPGGLDKNGGHVDKSTGKYHCHRANCVVPAEARVERGTVTVAVPKFRRREWGDWKDADNDCQDTRAEVLQRDSLVAVTFKNAKACVVTKGQWHDPYAGDQFQRAFSLDIDHIVPLEWANNHGGGTWPAERKQQFTNDLDNLVAVGAGVNRNKGAQGPDKWLPPEENFRCLYLAKFLNVYKKYDLQFFAAEQQGITAIATSCDLSL